MCTHTVQGCCYDSSYTPNCYYPIDARQDLYFFGHGNSECAMLAAILMFCLLVFLQITSKRWLISYKLVSWWSCLCSVLILVLFVSQVSGPIPIPPRFAFGVFYSRYWAYDDIGEMVTNREMLHY